MPTTAKPTPSPRRSWKTCATSCKDPTTLEPKIELDLDLRPEGKNGPLVRSYASCEEYYESWASTWERQALLRARVRGRRR